MPLARIARDQEEVALRTIQRWLRRYREQGVAGLARQPRADRGTRTFPPDQVRLIEGLALRVPPQSIAATHRRAIAIATEQGWPSPRYGTVYPVARRLHPGLVTLARDGSKAYRERYDLIHRREATGPNAIWQADHTHDWGCHRPEQVFQIGEARHNPAVDVCTPCKDEYQATQARTATLMDPGLTIDDLNPIAQGVIKRQYEQRFGESFPELRGNARDYVEWQALQPQGADTSVAAFVAWRDAQEAQNHIKRATPRRHRPSAQAAF